MIEIPKSGYWLTEENIETISSLKNAIYMGPWAIKTKGGGWTEEPVDVFYQETPAKAEFSNYFGILRKRDLANMLGHVYICAAESAFSENIAALKTPDGKILVSRYRHDYVGDGKGSFIDGGRDYTRYTLGNGNELLFLKVIKDKFVQVNEEEKESDKNVATS